MSVLCQAGQGLFVDMVGRAYNFSVYDYSGK
jgi:hypothetical protein